MSIRRAYLWAVFMLPTWGLLLGWDMATDVSWVTPAAAIFIGIHIARLVESAPPKP